MNYERDFFQHVSFQTNPIMSYGVIAFNEFGQLLSVCRLFSIGYCEFLNQCKTVVASPSSLRVLHFRRVFRQMTCSEKVKVLQSNPENVFTIFPILREELLHSMIHDPVYHEPEWGFPKGRKNAKEEAVKCALREFSEETGVPAGSFRRDLSSSSFAKPIHVFHEVFMGSNFRIYQHQYYLLPLFGVDRRQSIRDSSEISQVSWMNVAELRQKERPYYQQRFFLLHEVESFIRTYLQKGFSTWKPSPPLKLQTSISSTDSGLSEQYQTYRRAKNKQKPKKHLQTIQLTPVS